MPEALDRLLDEIRENAASRRAEGDGFERLILTYLRHDPLYKERFSDVWLWNDWPQRRNVQDTGIDIVAEERDGGGFCAVQCKFFAQDHNLQKGEIDSFFTTSGKEPFTSRIIVSTTDRWSAHAEDALRGQKTPVTRLRAQDLRDSPIDWSRYLLSRPQAVHLLRQKPILPHQTTALDDVLSGFRRSDRGKLIMACGTGKTFTALKIAERLAPKGGHILYLIPSISLVSQALREWTAQSSRPLRCLIVCSDSKAGKRSESEDISTHDLAFPATTNPNRLAEQAANLGDRNHLTVVFSTYQSIAVVSAAQARGLPAFDLAVCDEAHRTTGYTLADEDESHFVRIHDAKFIKAKKRLYMTATPRLYGDAAKSQAKERDAALCSMDDAALYGPEFHRLGFSDAVKRDLLSDYKVMVLAVDEKFVSKAFQRQLAGADGEIRLEDAVKITGCWNGLSKRMAKTAHGDGLSGDDAPMRRAVAFSRSIKESKRIKELFAAVVERYRELGGEDGMLACETEHVDGTFNALERNRMLDWLKATPEAGENVCRILSNARCLSEGVDVPALDAVMFLNPKNSVVDVVQSVGRVMRKSPGKKYGYIILPVGIPEGIPPEEALKDNERYKVVWQVLQALRAHDDRFNATVNKIELNKARPDQIQVIGVGGGETEDGAPAAKAVQFTFDFPHIEEWRNAIYARLVEKCGDRRYWETWAKEVAQIAERHTTRLKTILAEKNSKRRAAFAAYLAALKSNINPAIDEASAIEMLSQHLITRPVFDAIFEGYKFSQSNPVSLAIQKVVAHLEEAALEKETEVLDKFYASVREKAQGIDTAEGRQKIVMELYEKFFQTALPRLQERLGIVYTPVEVVDFILKSTDEVLRKEFGAGMTEEGVHVLDPFTGTGTFMARLIQLGLIRPEDLPRKFSSELHANEIVLLAYYIAAVNIEEAYHGVMKGRYKPFEGIVLTDTFQTTEGKEGFEDRMFPENNRRVARQNKLDIRVIVGNPPYSVGQGSENDDNKNLKYPNLDESIRGTYAKHSKAGLLRNLYDSYVRAIRWSSSRLKDRGVIAFITNGSFIDANSMDGLRKCLADEFSSIYCFNLRGDARTSGEQRRKEKGNVFGEGTRTPVAITLLVKNPARHGAGQIFYHDIGDYLSREEKLKKISEFGTVAGVPWVEIKPNSSHDWINQRDPAFENFMPLGDKDGGGLLAPFFSSYSLGVVTNRDAWTYNFSRKSLKANVSRLIEFYNQQTVGYRNALASKHGNLEVEDFIDNDPQRISWTRALKHSLAKGDLLQFKPVSVTISMYRPFCKQWLYFNRHLNEMVYLMPSLFPNQDTKNKVISVTGVGATKGFSALITDSIPNLHLHDTGQCYPLNFFQRTEEIGGLFANQHPASGSIRHEAIDSRVLNQFREVYDSKIGKDDIFYYVYGVLHSPEYKQRFESDLRRSIPRIPFARDFWAFSKAGSQLADLHLAYETIAPYPLKEFSDSLRLDPIKHYLVEQMRFAKKGREEDRTTIIFNSHLTLEGIPPETFQYVVNGKTALEWVMDRYQVKVDKDSKIQNDPNDWSEDPKYILNLVKRIVRVSIESVKITGALPPLKERS